MSAPLVLLPSLIVLLMVASPASAQVIRCTDPHTGKITYTDGDCPRGAAAYQVERAKTPEELAQERADAAQALQTKRERQQREAQQNPTEEKAPAPVAAPRQADPAQSADCRRARQALQEVMNSLGRGLYDEQARLDAAQQQANLACLTPAEQARAAARRTPPAYAPPVVVMPPRPHPRPPRRDISYCNVFRCYDKQGNSYPLDH